jgi:SAM-dependent methyltransferase
MRRWKGKDAMANWDAFQHAPYNAKPSEDWNRPEHWRDYYSDLLAEADPDRRQRIAHHDVNQLVWMLSQAGELPRTSPQTILDAGCGIALTPRVLEFWGFQVTAIDLCPKAIEIASQYEPTEEDLAGCVRILDPCEGRRNVFELVDDPARSLQGLRDLKGLGGSASYLVGDWFSAQLSPAAFGLIYCRNSLRCSTKGYWRRSLSRFRELLAPRGVLLLEHVNAFAVRAEVMELLAECGFMPLSAGAVPEPLSKYVLSVWPTG